MGLSITSSTPKGSGVNLGNLTGATPTNAAPGDFLALLSSELSNFLLAPVADTTQTLVSDGGATEDKSLSLETSGLVTPQVDPALLAALSAAAAATQKSLPTPAQNENITLSTLSTTAEGVSLLSDNQTPKAGTTLLTNGGADPKLIPFNLQIPANQPTKNSLLTDRSETGKDTQVRVLTPDQSGEKPLDLDLGKNTTSKPATSVEFLKAAGEPASPQSLTSKSATSAEFLKTTGEQTPPQSLTNTFSTQSNTAVIAQQLKPENHFETDVKTHIQEKIWPQQFGEKLVWMAKADVQSAQINLNPPELGPIQITLNLSGDQAKISFASPHLEVRQSIENALPQLKEMLSSSGISLGQANVGANLQQQSREAQYQSANERHRADENAILPGIEATIATGMTTSTQRGRGLVDLFA